MESLSPRRFQSGGGYAGYGPNNTPRRGVLTPTSPIRLKQQQVAQRMVNSDYNEGKQSEKPSINYSHSPRCEDYDDHIHSPSKNYNIGRVDIAESELTPPWETITNNSRENYIYRCAERAMRRRQDEEVHPPPAADENYMHNKQREQLKCELPRTPLSQIPQSPPRSTKSVSFNTRDKIHQWDDQLDQLKHVDEAFFAAAKFLLEDMHDLANDYSEKEENDFDLVQRIHGSGGLKGNKGAAGGGMLAKLFQCGGLDTISVGEGDNCKPYLGIDGEVLDDGTGAMIPSMKKFKLTEKLLTDFQAAVRYRMERLEDDDLDLMENRVDVASQIREIARKIDSYGLPKLWKNEIQAPQDTTATEECSKEGRVKPFRSEKSRQRRTDTHFFPVLPPDNDVDEKAHNSSNTAQPTVKSSSNLLSLFSSMFKSETTPSEEKCEENLHRIRREIQKLQQMNETTRNASVQSACADRIVKLNQEKRFYQIIREQYKIREMLKTTRIGSVKFACQERMKQLLLELESLDFEKEDVEKNEHWYNKAKQYVSSIQGQARTGNHGHQQQIMNKQHHQRQCASHHQCVEHEPMHTSRFSQQTLHCPAPLSSIHHQSPRIQQYSDYESSRSNMQPSRGQRLPLATPTSKKDNFMSYIAP